MNRRIAVIGTLDTKGPEIAYVAARIRALGRIPMVIDSGILGTPGISADITREEVAASAGRTLASILDAGSRGAAVELMQTGLTAIARRLYDDGEIEAVLCLGGAEGGLLGAAAMQALPVGVPKLILSPSASGRREFGPFVGSSDIVVMHSVIDILGINALSRSVFDNAVAAIVGMCSWGGGLPRSDRPAVGITMLGQTTPGAMAVARVIEDAGYEPIIFHANGVGGPAMDDLVREGLLSGVVDFTLSELANTIFDGIHATPPERMTAAPIAGVPTVVVPGAGDFFNQGPLGSVPDRYHSRAMYHHNPVATLVRVQEDEMRTLGRMIADRLRGASGPVEVVMPTGGLSLIGVPGGPIADASADRALLETLRAELPDDVVLIERPESVNDESLGRFVGERFIALAARSSRPSRSSRPEQLR
ncbi:UPF0261 family protein [Humibacter sp. BT305]|nr:UPF0261 family protein [Humibacter sp. BT305]